MEEPAGPEGFLEGEGGQGAESGQLAEAFGLQGSSKGWFWVLRSGFRSGGGLPKGSPCPFFQLILEPRLRQGPVGWLGVPGRETDFWAWWGKGTQGWRGVFTPAWPPDLPPIPAPCPCALGPEVLSLPPSTSTFGSPFSPLNSCAGRVWKSVAICPLLGCFLIS